ncbi:MAG: glycine betaine/L-proline ABC transporter ATP-binding protein [Spirochaetales bacterium]|nr:glycine betaine/L-proline ABC transporter ATP-binding protein [Spirochaetales bacterium]
MSTENIIEIQGLWKVFGKDPKRAFAPAMRQATKEEMLEKTGCIAALRDVNIEIQRGEFFIIMGLSGSGKSTLIRTLTRLIHPSKGRILVKGQDIVKMSKEQLLDYRRSVTAMVFQHYGLFPHLSVMENAAYGLKVKGMKKEEREAKAQEALITVGLEGWEDYYPDALSGGMQQRVGLARALANEPEVLLMDEPFSGLDPLIRRQMQDELVELQDTLKKTIVFVTHDLTEALKLGDRIAIMKDGDVVQIGTPEEILTEPANDYVRDFVQDASPVKYVTASSLMEDPTLLLYDWEGANTALHMLQQAHKSFAFVVDKSRRITGLCTRERLREYVRNNPGDKQALRIINGDLVKKDLPTTGPDEVLEDIFAVAGENPYPVPVVHPDTGKLLGVVRSQTIFESMISEDSEEESQEMEARKEENKSNLDHLMEPSKSKEPMTDEANKEGAQQ